MSERIYQTRLSLKDACQTGFHFCLLCRKIVAPVEADGYYRCPHCHGIRIKWCPPVPRN